MEQSGGFRKKNIIPDFRDLCNASLVERTADCGPGVVGADRHRLVHMEGGALG